MNAAAPADTTMVRIVHDALRRDLRRAQGALTRTPPPPVGQQRAIARHLCWMMGFLRAHHHAEETGFSPLVRERVPAAADLLDAMAADHDEIAGAIAEVEAAASGMISSARDEQGHRQHLVAALGHLSDVLLPHLEREEDDVMPLVSSAITDAEWRALEREHTLAPKSFVELGREGHWLIDAATQQDRETVLNLVPPVPRFVLLHGFAAAYRRRAARCWAGRPERRVQKAGQCQVPVDAPIDAVWAVVRDVTRTGEWSHECVEVAWLDGATSAVPGARFRGRNRASIFRWGRVCEIIGAEPHELVWRTVPTALYPDSTVWTIRLRPDGGGTTLEQTFAAVRVPKVLEVLYALVIPTHRDRTAALTEDLRRLGSLAINEADPRHPQPLAGV
jgi:hypothetical protein